MQQPMDGVRILEIAQYTFVPAAGAVFSDWGAEVIKIEHPETGDAQRGLIRLLGLDVASKGTSFAPIMEGPNRGKRSIGLALDQPESRPILEELIRRSDVLLTNYMPRSRAKLKIDVEDVRAINPNIIYVRGTGFGNKGEERDKGGYDSTAFWARGGSGAGVTPHDSDQMMAMPAGAYGDSIGGMTIAGGIAAALYKRATTGETSVVDVSLLGVGAWSMQFSINLALLTKAPLPVTDTPKHGAPTNPLTGTYRTSDGRWIMLTMLQPGRYWSEFCAAVGHPELATDDRFDTTDKIMANAAEAGEIVAGIFKERDYKSWIAVLETVSGQWAAVQDPYEVGQDPSLRANGMIAPVTDAEGVERELVTNPVQFDGTPPTLRRAPLFAEHTDEILRELGLNDDELIELKIAGAVS